MAAGKPKAVKKEVVEEEGVVHIRIDKPLSLRKEILKSAIDVTKIMQEYEDIILLRNSELALIDDLKDLNKDIINLQKKLIKDDLPELPEEHNKLVPDLRHTIGAHETIKYEEVKGASDIDKLKAELNAIESRLKEL